MTASYVQSSVWWFGFVCFVVFFKEKQTRNINYIYSKMIWHGNDCNVVSCYLANTVNCIVVYRQIKRGAQMGLVPFTVQYEILTPPI